MSRKTSITVSLLILGLSVGVYYYQAQPPSAAHSAPEPSPPAKPQPIHVATVERGSIRQITTASGDILAAAKVDVFSKVEGRLEAINVEQGDVVQQNQIIARIVDAELQAKMERATAELEVLQAQWAQMQAGERQEEIAQARDRVERTRAERDNAARALQRAQALYERGLYATREVEDAALKATQAQTAHAMAQKQLRILRSGAREEDREALQAQLRAAEAALRLATTELRNAIITAPMSGIVSHRHVDPGAYINASTSLVTLVDMQSVKIKVPISERNIGMIVPGLPAQIHVDAYPQAVFVGSVRRISPTLDLATRSADIEIVIDNADLRLKPGMFAKVTLIIQQRHEALIVPRQAVRHEDDVTSVFVVQDGKAHRRQVTMGLQNEAQVEILDNLEAGTSIVLAGHSNLKDQTPVTVVGQQEGS